MAGESAVGFGRAEDVDRSNPGDRSGLGPGHGRYDVTGVPDRPQIEDRRRERSLLQVPPVAGWRPHGYCADQGGAGDGSGEYCTGCERASQNGHHAIVCCGGRSLLGVSLHESVIALRSLVILCRHYGSTIASARARARGKCAIASGRYAAFLRPV